MMQTVKKWKVTVTTQNGRDMTFWVNDNFLSNVMRTVASLDFCPGIEQPRRIDVREETEAVQTGVALSVGSV